MELQQKKKQQLNSLMELILGKGKTKWQHFCGLELDWELPAWILILFLSFFKDLT